MCTLAGLRGHALHRPPPGLDLRNPEALTLHIASAPVSAMLLVLRRTAGAREGDVGVVMQAHTA